jgi:hypothetical protein
MLYPNGFDMDVMQNWAVGSKIGDGTFVQEFQKHLTLVSGSFIYLQFLNNRV